MITIPLNQGYTTVADDDDAELAELNWSLMTGRSGNLYARRTVVVGNRQKTLLMHRVIYSRMTGADLLPRQEVDHINLDGLNNCRWNLRLATHQKNSFNSSLQRNNTSGATGVMWVASLNKWRARIAVDGALRHLGLFPTFEDAVEARRQSELSLFGEFAPTRIKDVYES